MVVIQSVLVKWPLTYKDQILMVPKVVINHMFNCITFFPPDIESLSNQFS